MQLLKSWLFDKHLLSSYYVPDALLSIGNSKMRKMKSLPICVLVQE